MLQLIGDRAEEQADSKTDQSVLTEPHVYAEQQRHAGQCGQDGKRFPGPVSVIQR